MSKRLPSLTSLRTFEAAARHLSFAKAAHELFVTPAAVGFQIKQLEQELGGALFLRKHRAVELTERGRDLLTDLGPAFKSIQSAWDAAHEPVETTVLKVSGPAKAVHSWVLPAISNAKEQRSDVRISWDLSKQVRDVSKGEVDMAIRWALEPEGDLHWEPLLRTWFTPLMRPDIARYVERPSDIGKQGLIGVDFVLDSGRENSTWSSWHRLNGLEPPTDFAVTCADTASAVETAIATGHVAIAGSFLASKQLAKGELVAPFDTAIEPLSKFWLVCRKGLETTPEYRWFLSEVHETGNEIDAQRMGMRLFHPDGSPVAT
ncbi:LysR substrate-binding domain-containing protein [Alisedimentitalea sp. MJ-SS2]|uniref:LysR substrate-binding domain-containing protein n=1 Tax=Aliisedimentitalea sp. MJ-SS2 TaxID=3049795 RepID=UPI00291380F8|nr:LysR substrate-binding domain-containing protein [Alisedimentitalea sp. MJ-SS2]MDU8927425.1 LysR substrate-binding domain-containing protein [Alisedimentitalea sp. MJ-SS2]